MKSSLEWIDAMTTDLQDFVEEFGTGWGFTLQRKLKGLRKSRRTRTTEWLVSFNEMLDKYRKESALTKKNPKSAKLRTSSKLISR
jgi:hypothetical protein